MDNPRNLTILKKCVNSTSSLQTFVQGIEKTLSKDPTNVKEQSKLHVVGEIVNISDIETLTFGPAIVETVYCAGVEPTFETTISDGKIIAEVEDDIGEVEPEQGVLEVDVAEELEVDTGENVFEAEMVEEESVEEEILAGVAFEICYDENFKKEGVTEVEADVVDEENVAEEILAEIEADLILFDLKDLCPKIGKNFTKNEDGEKVTWADIKELLVEKQNPNIVKYKTSFAQKDYKSFKVSNEPKYIDLKPAYPKGPPLIPTLKKKDLMDLCRQNSITASHHQFFHNLKAEEIPSSSAGKRRRAGA